jgi:nicotinamidase-related amidase|tara:strand:- start:7711 stop:7860 length:150 start_codon:yes stop_codon:yes gene_type:complete
VPGRTAVVVIDAQNDFLYPDGWYGKGNIDISQLRRVIEPMIKLLDAAPA